MTSLWERPTETNTYREEVREFDGVKLVATRRTLSFPEETRILARVVDPQTKRPDTLAMLGLTVGLAVKEMRVSYDDGKTWEDFGLTPERIRDELPDRPTLAWFLIKWLCADTLQNIGADKVEELSKKSGP
jgi:hypothetical protein